MNYYNEFDPDAAQWIRNLIAAGLIPPGDVDERSIEDVTPNELRKYTQCHFFAGIAGWPLALDIAGWPRDMPIWSGSCPCQPFSSAGKGAGFDDQRHLWPAWFHLIRECRPERVFGEQVASAIGHGWLDLVQADMEAEGYACGGAVLGAHSVGAPHIRQRLYWVADSESKRLGETRKVGARRKKWVADGGAVGELGNAIDTGLQGHGRPFNVNDAGGREGAERHGATAGFWSGAEWIACRDGKARPVKSGLEPLVAGLPRGMVYGSDCIDAEYANKTAESRVIRLKAYGNSIVPKTAAEFITAFMAAQKVGIEEAA